MCFAVVMTSSETEALFVPELDTETFIIARSAGCGISDLPVTMRWNGVEDIVENLVGYGLDQSDLVTECCGCKQWLL